MKEKPKNTKKSIIIAMNATRNWVSSDTIPNHCGVLMDNYADLVGI
jgi:hypothetical protein